MDSAALEAALDSLHEADPVNSALDALSIGSGSHVGTDPADDGMIVDAALDALSSCSEAVSDDELHQNSNTCTALAPVELAANAVIEIRNASSRHFLAIWFLKIKSVNSILAFRLFST